MQWDQKQRPREVREFAFPLEEVKMDSNSVTNMYLVPWGSFDHKKECIIFSILASWCYMGIEFFLVTLGARQRSVFAPGQPLGAIGTGL